MGRRIPDWEILNWLSAEKKTETGKTTLEITNALRASSDSFIHKRLDKLEAQGKVVRVRHGHVDFWYLAEIGNELKEVDTPALSPT